jgi:uncharacterized protein YndB with AHSA1/START domain
MKNKNFTVSVLVDQSPAEVFKSVNNPRGWWGEGIKGETKKLNDEFVYRHQPYHYSKQRLIELVPDQKVVWQVIDGELSFTEDKSEWKDTKIIFEIEKQGQNTALRFTHEGLTPASECFDDCSQGWNHYLQSLVKLIETGKGEPDKKEKAL